MKKSLLVSSIVTAMLLYAVSAFAVVFDWSESAFLSGPGSAPWLIVGFDPQPEPPGYGGTIKGFDPQPEPPGKVRFGLTVFDTSFDPQPEPPGFGLGFSDPMSASYSFGTIMTMGNEIQLPIFNATGAVEYIAMFGFEDMNNSLLFPGMLVGFDPQPEPPGMPANSMYWGFNFSLSSSAAAFTPYSGDAYMVFSLERENGALVPLNVVPEPSTFLLLGGGLAGLAIYARRRRKE